MSIPMSVRRTGRVPVLYRSLYRPKVPPWRASEGKVVRRYASKG
jgi:hypothetical protein